MQNPYLVGEKVYLRALTREDLRGGLLRWANDPLVTQFMYMGTFPNTIEALEHEYDILMGSTSGSLLQSPTFPANVVMAVVLRETDLHIGNVGLFGINWVTRVAEFRSVVGERQYWGGGVSTEAYRLMIAYAFDRLNLRKLMAGTRADHVASAVMLKKVGFVQEGRLREHFLRDEKTYDILFYGLLRGDFRRPPPARETS
jgi:RimJ/RimL family protein N-acetyltransferase